jgi:glycosyltransferase involved in cell wall biosynthesis
MPANVSQRIQPPISIGMPVRNGAAHIAQAIESLLNQTLGDFELAVYDNASADDTFAIVSAIAAKDARVRIVRHERNIGGAANFIHAAEQATGEFFCWAAHDDLREPTFLATLLDLLRSNLEAALACCDVRNIDPDGTMRDIRPETASLRTATGMNVSHRLRMYLRETPGTPFYGLFRSKALRASLDVLHEMNALCAGGPALLGIDMIFLARFLRDHGFAYAPQPLLLFRRGGVSHDLGRYGSLRGYFRQLRFYWSEMKSATTVSESALLDRLRVRTALCRSMARWLLSREMRPMTAHYLAGAMPILRAPRAWFASHASRDLRRLRRRIASLPGGSRIVLFGAGKHTRRRLTEVRTTLGRRARLIAACDDRADACPPLRDLPIVSPPSLAELKPDVLLVSSDAYEQAMFRRACAVAPPGVRVWTIYDHTLDAGAVAGSCSMASTSATNAAISASVSRPAMAAR